MNRAAVSGELIPAAGPLREGSRAQAVIPRATYRLQLHKGFGFDAARSVLPYLERLGISHVYCSPITRARPGSLHGYDVIDHAQINPELGGEDGFLRFASAARARGMGLLLDQVPNHMGVFGEDNAWWMDVLAHGPASEHARAFDIDWQPPNPALAGKLLVPVLGAPYGEVLDAGEIRLVLEAERGMLVLRYHQHRFPLDPSTCPLVLLQAAAKPELGDSRSGELLRELAAALAGLPPRDTTEPTLLQQRREGARQQQQRLAQWLDGLVEGGSEAAAHIAAAIEAVVADLNAAPGRDALHALHEAQAYRLAHWRMAADEINYRRFFDVNELGALRIEDEAVFEAVQGKALDLAQAGWVDGLRIDHPDGLLDPATYFARLQQGMVRRLGLPVSEPPARPLYVVAEKIAAGYEDVPTDWALHGTTGYRFAMLVNGLFVERRHERRMSRLWQLASGDQRPFADLVHEAKREVATGALSAQLTVLTQALQRIALADRRTRDHGHQTLREALAEVAAAMPVYRTYVCPRNDGQPAATAQDRRFIDWAIAQARQRSRGADASLFDFIRRCLLAETDTPAMAEAVGRFALAFQQFCAPVAAKGVEDTAFYRYHRLVSLNEVGGDPAVFGISAAAFHGASADRAARWPHTMLATSTHDNKRSEDVRNRINVLSERPALWRLSLTRWKMATRAWRTEVAGRPAPSAEDQVLLHQTLLGTLPAEGLGADTLPAYRERIEAYAIKAAREAKQHTRWARPDEAYEAALTHFVRGLLGRLEGNPVLAELQARAAELAWYGALNTWSMTVLKFCSPGVPDLYQGSELIDLSLVDPDNRRPVDHVLRSQRLTELERVLASSDPPQALRAMARVPTDGRLKLWLIWRLLALRRLQPALFESGRYSGMRVQGAGRHRVIAFTRRGKGQSLTVIAGRKFTGLPGGPGQLPLGGMAWADTRLQMPHWLPAEARGTDVLSLAPRRPPEGPLMLAEVLDTLPVSVIHWQHR
jgi:(1->4)-alpha-D-glucan 1-alpha-D-glucosylmutase